MLTGGTELGRCYQEALNAHRASSGRPPLPISPEIAENAQKHILSLIDEGRTHHADGMYLPGMVEVIHDRICSTIDAQDIVSFLVHHSDPDDHWNLLRQDLEEMGVAVHCEETRWVDKQRILIVWRARKIPDGNGNGNGHHA